MTGSVILHAPHVSDRAALQESERRLRDIFDGLGPSMFVGLLTTDGILVDANRSALVSAGLQPADVLGKHFAETYWWAHSPSAQAQLRAAIARAAHGEASRYDVEVQAAEDRLIDVDFSLQPRRDEQGDIVFLVASAIVITERKQTENALRESNEKFQLLADNITDAIWIRSPDMREVHYVSPAFERMWGAPVGYLYSNAGAWVDFVVPEDRERAEAEFAKLTRDCPSIDIEYRITRFDGTIRWIRARGFQVRDAAGKLIRLTGIATDIHELKLAQFEIARTNRALKMLSASMAVMIRAEEEQDLLERICQVAVETGGYRMAWVGYARDDELRSITPMAHAGFEEGYLSDVRVRWDEHDPLGRGPAGEVIRSGRMDVREYTEGAGLDPWLQHARKRGYRSVIALPLRNATRTFGLLSLYSADSALPNTEELTLLQDMADNLAFGVGNLRAHTQVREQAALLDIAHEAIQVKDLDGRILFWNKGAERTYGWTAAEAVGRTAVELLDRDAATFSIARAALIAKGEWAGEMIKRTKDGRKIAVDVRWTLVRDAQGRPKAILAINTDVTEKKTFTSQLMVSDRMASVGTLAAGVAHEINNPLAAVVANLDYITESVERLMQGDHGAGFQPRSAAWMLEEIKGPLDDARDAAQRVRLIVRDLKILSRSPDIETTSAVNVETALDASLGMARNEIRHRGRLVKKYAMVPDVEANEARLGQVFLNLIVNAAQALPDGHAEENEICVSTLLEGGRVIVEVSDTGSGIPPEIVGRIFDAFFTTKAVGVGTGLGLAISQRIVADMGGELTVTSTVGKGTTFRVALPVARAAPRPPEAPVVATPVSGRRGRILVVDDEAMVVRAVTRTLSAHHDVVGVLGAQEALARCTSGESFDLIICDLMMPGMTGMDLHHELSRIAPDQAKRMLFLTGGAFTVAAQEFLARVPADHIEKPFDGVGLRKIVRTFVR